VARRFKVAEIVVRELVRQRRDEIATYLSKYVRTIRSVVFTAKAGVVSDVQKAEVQRQKLAILRRSRTIPHRQPTVNGHPRLQSLRTQGVDGINARRARRRHIRGSDGHHAHQNRDASERHWIARTNAI
jgi:hypothetical protein